MTDTPAISRGETAEAAKVAGSAEPEGRGCVCHEAVQSTNQKSRALDFANSRTYQIRGRSLWLHHMQ